MELIVRKKKIGRCKKVEEKAREKFANRSK